MFYPFFDVTMIILLPAIIFCAWAQHKVTQTYASYSKINSSNHITARDAARILLDRHSLQNIPIRHVAGNLTDHYNPEDKTLNLSDSVYSGTSIAAIGVAAHEVGHAIQDSEGYKMLRFRNTIVPVVNIGSTLSMPLFIAGLIFGWIGLVNIGILLFTGVLIFHLVTLPVELDASSRALALVKSTNILTVQETEGARKVLHAAALTYLGALLMTIMQLIRLIALRNMRRD